MSHSDYRQFLISDGKLAKLAKMAKLESFFVRKPAAFLRHLHVWLQFASEMRYVNAINI